MCDTSFIEFYPDLKENENNFVVSLFTLTYDIEKSDTRLKMGE